MYYSGIARRIRVGGHTSDHELTMVPEEVDHTTNATSGVDNLMEERR